MLCGAALILSVTGCNRSERDQQKQNSANSQTTQEDSAPPNSIQLDMNGDGEKSPPDAVQAGSAELGPHGFLLPAGRISAVPPKDFVIGELALSRASASRERSRPAAAVARLVHAFFLEASLQSDRIHPGSRQRLTRSLEGRWRSSTAVRVAAPDELSDGRWRVNVRLLSPVGEAVGEVYVEEHDRSWYISDVAVPLLQLDDPRPERTFQPGQPPSSSGL